MQIEVKVVELSRGVILRQAALFQLRAEQEQSSVL